MFAQPKSTPDQKQTLATALLNAGRSMGLSQTDIGKIIGKDRSSIGRGIDPGSKAGELALILIRCYRSLYVLVGGKEEDIKHWMQTDNHHLGGIPSTRVLTATGLVHTLEYLDALRGKV